MQLTERLVQGVDVWLNMPRRPWEACGTSGMKVLVNGGLNLSELDGWWAEAYEPNLGWSLGDGQEHGSDPALDAVEAEALYERLEREVIPEFYDRNEKGIPVAWVARMRESMAQLTPRFSADRAVREYAEQHYLPAAAAYHSRVANKGEIGRQLVDWRHSLEQKWGALRFGDVKVETKGGEHIFDVQVYLDDLDPKAVQVELYADAVNGGRPARQEMKPVRPLVGACGGYVYSAAVSATRPPGDYTARVIPRFEGAAVPLEAVRILWQR
jgi:starch phosphorylase